MCAGDVPAFYDQSGNGQSWGQNPYSLWCAGFPPMYDQHYIFDDLNACYFGNTNWNAASDDCDIDGCRCDATLSYLSNLVTGEHSEDSLINNSGVINGTGCTDPRFDF